MANGKDLSIRLKELFEQGYALKFNPHCLLRMKQRQINEDEVIDMVKSAKNLKMVEKQKAKFPGEEKYDCWFVHGKRLAFVVNLVIKKQMGEIEVITVVKNRLDKQERFDKNVTHF